MVEKHWKLIGLVVIIALMTCPVTFADKDKGSVASRVEQLEKQMWGAAKKLDFERATSLRDQLKKLKMVPRIEQIEKQMWNAAKKLDFERAASLRNKLKGLNSGGMPNGDKPIVNGSNDSGYSVFKLYRVADGTLVENFYIEKGKSTISERGGGMYIQGYGPCTIKNCIFDNNLANKLGGALYIEFHNPTIQDCVFKNNEVKYSPAQGGAIYTWFCEGDIIGCNIGLEVSNYAPSSDSDEIYTGSGLSEYVPTYQDCGIRGGLYGNYCDYDTTPPIDGGGNYQ